MSIAVPNSTSQIGASALMGSNVSRIQSYNESQRRVRNGMESSDLSASAAAAAATSGTGTVALKKGKNQTPVDEMSVLDKIANQKIIQRMNKKITFLKNPRFKVVRPPIQFPDLISRPEICVDSNDVGCPFRATPSEIVFWNYEIDRIYEITLNITNIDKVSRRIKFLPPELLCFSVKNVRYPTTMPQSSEELQALRSQELGMIAPGMSVVFTIQFFARTLQEQVDSISIVNEINAFKVPILARRNPPEINLPELLDCKSCWIGDSSTQVFKFTNKGGDCGFRFFTEAEAGSSDENDPNENRYEGQSDTLVTGNFELYPNEFYMQKGETQEIVVTFTPQKEGVERAKVILACDNHTSAQYTLMGSGNMSQIDIYGIDALRVSDFNDSAQEMSRIFFEKSLPGITRTRTLLLKNQTDVNVKYHWNLFKQDGAGSATTKEGNLFSDKPSDFAFSITPSSGVFASQEVVEFKIVFACESPFAVYENITLFIDDIPLASVKQISPHLQEFVAKQLAIPTTIPRENLPGFIGCNSPRPSLAYLNFELIGLSAWAAMALSKPMKIFPTLLAVHQAYEDSFVIRNNSDAKVNFDILSTVSNPGVSVEIVANKGTIEANQEFEVKLNFTSKKVGDNQKAVLSIHFDIGHSVTYEVIGSFTGPRVRLEQPVLEFGLLKVMQQKIVELIVENTSPVNAEVSIRDLNQKKKKTVSRSLMKLSSMSSQMGEDQVKEVEAAAVAAAMNRDEDDLEEAEVLQTKCELHILQPVVLLKPFEKRAIQVLCKAGIPESFRTLLELSVEHSQEKLFLNVQAEVQKIQVTLNRLSLNFPCLYANTPTRIASDNAQQYIQIQNIGNIDAEFEWEPIEEDQFTAEVVPRTGTVKAKSTLDVELRITALKGTSLNYIFVCNVKHVKYPLGFEVSAVVQGLSVELSHIVFTAENSLKSKPKVAEENDNTNLFNSLVMKSNVKNSSLLRSMRDSSIYQSLESSSRLSRTSQAAGVVSTAQPFEKKPAEKLEFLGCQINKPKTIHLLLSNTSGLPTHFNINSTRFQPTVKDKVAATTAQKLHDELGIDEIEDEHEGDDDTQEMLNAMNSGRSKTGASKDQTARMSLRGNQSSVIAAAAGAGAGAGNKMGNSNLFRINQVKNNKAVRESVISLLTNEIEQKNFNSKAGAELNAARKTEKQQRHCLMNDKGFAVIFEPSSGSLIGHQEQLIKVTVFNDVSGHVEDVVKLEIEGLETRMIPVEIDVQGSPLIVSPFQLGINYKGAYPVFDVGSYMKSGGVVEREFRVRNTGPKVVKIDWKMYNLNAGGNSDADFFELKIADPVYGSADVCKLQFNAIPPPISENGPFFVEPMNVTIQEREEVTFKVRFSSDDAKDFTSVLIAEPVMLNAAGSEDRTIKIDQLVLGLEAHTIKPHLYLDKLLTHDGRHILKLEKWALFENNKEWKEICLVNNQLLTVKFELVLDGEFVFDSIMSTCKANSLGQIAFKQSQGLSKSVVNQQSKHLGSARQGSASLAKGSLPVGMTYTLEQNTNMKLLIRFKGKPVHDEQAWPMTNKNYEFGKLSINYSNGDCQEIDLEGHLLRPFVMLNTSGHEDIPGQDIQEFGVVHIRNSKSIQLFLANKSKVPAKWKVHHVKNPFKKFLGTATMTQVEKENNSITDDADVFSFSVTEGLLNGPSIPVKSLPETLSLPTMVTTMKNFQNEIIPQSIMVNFKPKKNVLYKSKYRISVEEGPTVDFILRGTGSYQEEDLV